VETPDANRDAGCAQRTGKVHGARKLVSLYAHQPHQSVSAIAADLLDQLLRAHPRVGLVAHGDADLDLCTQHLAPGAVERKAVECCKSIGRDRRARPLNDVSVVVVV
jgi:hypothetical protein